MKHELNCYRGYKRKTMSWCLRRMGAHVAPRRRQLHERLNPLEVACAGGMMECRHAVGVLGLRVESLRFEKRGNGAHVVREESGKQILAGLGARFLRGALRELRLELLYLRLRLLQPRVIRLS